jgi:hypothetical protein
VSRASHLYTAVSQKQEFKQEEEKIVRVSIEQNEIKREQKRDLFSVVVVVVRKLNYDIPSLAKKERR